jgi:uncharacterized membrane protein YfcA
VELASHAVEIVGMLAGGVAAAWFGASALPRIPKTRITGVISAIRMCIGSLIGATIGGYLAAWAPTDALRVVLATILAGSAVKLWSKRGTAS